eukprot:NODE_12683_length_501_cov_127.227513_g12391_i0.p1 GENE.NODE_12683_length_501_cov_127.227513_g12391_i0~~NODE_12683_length_501_cov_127.227513_g12391_i0.p1  ORF type:complete len:137 (-),score=38.24 NODE_12683_length_501_cov_127.227513_g12391_i0:91-444(-)
MKAFTVLFLFALITSTLAGCNTASQSVCESNYATCMGGTTTFTNVCSCQSTRTRCLQVAGCFSVTSELQCSWAFEAAVNSGVTITCRKEHVCTNSAGKMAVAPLLLLIPALLSFFLA